LNESFSNVIKDCLIDSSVNDGILIDVGSNNNIIEQNHITSNDIGVFLTNANSQNVIRDNSIETNITAGIGIYRDTGTLSMISIRDNYFENDGADNIKIYSVGTAGTRMVIIDGNYFYSPSGTTNFINIDYGDDISIRDNNFGDGNVSCIHIKTSVHTGIVNLYPNVHYGTSFNNGTYLDITGTPVNWIRGIRGTPATGNIIKWNVGGYAEWVAP
jgi:parallel beta-helix repeat protein